jgi:hypothetical protein
MPGPDKEQSEAADVNEKMMRKSRRQNVRDYLDQRL